MENNGEKFLPIGTVVQLKNGTKDLMITSYLVFQSESGTGNEFMNGNANVFDYGACLYPEGILDAKTSYAFNHSQIEKILYLGYRSQEQIEFLKKLTEGYETIKKQNNVQANDTTSNNS